MNGLHRAGIALAACIVFLLAGAAARSQSISTDKQIYRWGEPITIAYTAVGGEGFGYQIEFLDLSGQPGKSVETHVLNLDPPEETVPVEPGGGTVTFDSARLKTADRARGWYELVLRDQALATLAHVPILVLREWPMPVEPRLFDDLGQPLSGAITVGVPIRVQVPADRVDSYGMTVELWAPGADRPAASTGSSGPEAELDTRDVAPGRYRLRVTSRSVAPLPIAETEIDLVVRALPGRITLDAPSARYAADKLPSVETNYGGDSLTLFRLGPNGEQRRIGSWSSLSYGVQLQSHFYGDDALPPGDYELRLYSHDGRYVRDRVPFEVVPPAAGLVLRPGTRDGYPPDALPTVEADNVGTLVLYRIGEEAVLGEWALGQGPEARAAIDLQAEFAAAGGLPPGDYELQLYIEGDFFSELLDSLRFTVVEAAASPAAKVRAPTLRLTGEGRVEIGAEVVVAVDGLPAGTPAWLSLHRLPQVVDGCALREETSVRTVLVDTEGMQRTHLRFPLMLEAGEVSMTAPWVPGRYEVRLYSGEPPIYDVPDFPDAPLLARAELEVSWPESEPELPLTLALRNGSTFKAGEVPEVTVRATAEGLRLVDAWDDVRIGLYRSAEVMPGGGISFPGRLVLEWPVDLTGESFDLALEPLDVPPGPYEIRLTVGYPEEPQQRFMVRVPIDVTADYTPALPPDAAFRRAADGMEDGFWPQPAPPPPCDEAVVAGRSEETQPVAAAEQASEPPVLTVVEWYPGRFGDESDDEYRPVNTVFPGYPYFLEARFAEPLGVDTYSVTLANGVMLTLEPTADATLYRSRTWFRVVEPEAQP